jgi:hypothetical protein
MSFLFKEALCSHVCKSTEMQSLLQQSLQKGSISIGFIEGNISMIPSVLWKLILQQKSLINCEIFEHFKTKCTGSTEEINLIFKYLPWESRWKEELVLFCLLRSLQGRLSFWFALLANYRLFEEWMQISLLEIMIQGAKVTNDAWKASLAVHFLGMYHGKPVSQLCPPEEVVEVVRLKLASSRGFAGKLKRLLEQNEIF